MEAALNQAKKVKPVFEYDLPEEVVALNDPHIKKSVGLVKLDMSEEVEAAARANGNQAKLAYAWARFALVEVDGRRLNKAEAEDEIVLQNTDPTIRELILAAYADMSTNSEVVTKKFLKSRRVKVG